VKLSVFSLLILVDQLTLSVRFVLTFMPGLDCIVLAMPECMKTHLTDVVDNLISPVNPGHVCIGPVKETTNR